MFKSMICVLHDHNWLVVSKCFKHLRIIFHVLYRRILHIDFHIFFRGVGIPTSRYLQVHWYQGFTTQIYRAMAMAGGYAQTARKLKFVKLSGEEIPCHLAGSTYKWVVHHSDNPWIIHEFHTVRDVYMDTLW